jgi:hypothetical protein
MTRRLALAVLVAFAAGLLVGMTVVRASTPRPTPGPRTHSAQAWTGAPVASGTPSSDPDEMRPVPRPVAQPTAKPSAAIKHRQPVREGRTGLASTYGPGWDGWIAWPAGPGYRLRVCGAGGCRTVTSNDAGPAPEMLRAGRVIDLDVPTFEAVCGIPWWPRGLCPVTVTVLGR